MFIIEIIPLTKISPGAPQILTYFYPQPLEIGALVSVPLSRRQIRGIVINCGSLSEKKMEIRKKGFGLKKVDGIISRTPIIFPYQFSLVQFIRQYYVTSLGVALKLFVPRSLLNRKKLVDVPSVKEAAPTLKKGKALLYWSRERRDFYWKESEKAIKKGKQVLILAPEVRDIEQIAQLFDKNEKLKVSVSHSELGVRQEFQEWQKIRSGEINVVVGTRSAVFSPFQSLGLIIVEKEESQNHKSWDQYPRYDARVIALKAAKFTGAKIILGSSLPSADSYYRAKQGQYKLIKPEVGSREACPERRRGVEGQKLKVESKRLKVVLVDMREEIRKGNFSIFSDGLQERLKTVLLENRSALLFVNRRGAASSVLCRDCGHVIKCGDCDVAMVYHDFQKHKESVLRCHHCGFQCPPPSLCPKCESHRIKYAGVGTQKVIKDLQILIDRWQIKNGARRVGLLDTDTAPDFQKQSDIFSKLSEKGLNVLIGTQLLLKYNQRVDLAAVVLIDPILNLPEYRSAERVFQLLSRFKSQGEAIIIQTYNPDLELFQLLKEDKEEDFLKKEVEMRQMLAYPPFSQIIRLTYAHKDSKKASQEAEGFKRTIDKFFKANNLVSAVQVLGPAPAFIERIRGKNVWQLILKVKEQESKVKRLLLKTPLQGWTIEVDPENLL